MFGQGPDAKLHQQEPHVEDRPSPTQTRSKLIYEIHQRRFPPAFLRISCSKSRQRIACRN